MEEGRGFEAFVALEASCNIAGLALRVGSAGGELGDGVRVVGEGGNLGVCSLWSASPLNKPSKIPELEIPKIVRYQQSNFDP